ncbi:hypothetical protein Patl1_15337 [Pistacia atlantica]|uniref:Uncharacterized protein n=1 Tax=Pistacia atlantica TaxID=434234 RepID=A0ACC1B5L5_9ROSI|nr:hypothetical protein Patl1_15337 [Pistacia atlantica]
MSDKRKSIYEIGGNDCRSVELGNAAFIFQPYFVENIPLLNSINLNMVNQIILQGEEDITFTKFRPSIIAASAFLTACKIQKFDNYQECKDSFINCFLNEEMLQDCTEKTYTMWTSLMGSTDENVLNEAVEKDANIGWPLNFPLKWKEM